MKLKHSLVFIQMSICLLVTSGEIKAQNQRNNWFMGTYLGMKFIGNTMSIIPVNTSPMYAPYGSATYSDPVTGDLLLYTNGSYVYNKNHIQMPNGLYLNEETYSVHTVIVSYPGNPNLFYIISSGGTGQRIYYSLVDMSLQNGLGDVISSRNILNSFVDMAFCVVKQQCGGYWLITHSAQSNQFRTYRIGYSGLDTIPVVSSAGTPSGINPGFMYGKMVSTSTGKKFVFAQGSANNTATCEEFLFDKASGKVSFSQAFLPHIIQADERYAFPAYSSDDSKLFVSWGYSSGQMFVLQYNLNDSDPNSTYVRLHQNAIGLGDMQLAPDGKIYVAAVENAAVTARISTIENPNSLPPVCVFRDRNITLSPDPSLHFTEHFPEFIMDVSPDMAYTSHPKLFFENVCEGKPVTFSLSDTLTADSFLWKLGDGYSDNRLTFTHEFASTGDYEIKFIWYRCGNLFSITDTVRLRNNPVVNLGNDTLLCAGTIFELSGPDSASQYLWNTGQSTQNISVSKSGLYVLWVRNAQCEARDTILIKYHEPLFTALGDEYFICDDDKELVKLDAGKDFAQYKWTPTGDTAQWIIVGDLGKYFVVVTDYRGCRGSDGTKVERRCPVSVFYPNAFTPNNDGLNDTYLPVGTDVVDFEMSIYNAWGQLVFKTNDIRNAWDGKVDGVPAPSGAYIYHSTYSGYRNKQLMEFYTKGNVTLMR